MRRILLTSPARATSSARSRRHSGRHRADSFRDGALLAVNLGDDADTTGAIYGQFAGAFHGEQAIPAEWRARLARRELIESFADRLLDLRATLAGHVGA